MVIRKSLVGLLVLGGIFLLGEETNFLDRDLREYRGFRNFRGYALEECSGRGCARKVTLFDEEGLLYATENLISKSFEIDLRAPKDHTLEIYANSDSLEVAYDELVK